MATNEKEVRETALGNPLILRTILDCLNTKELLDVSLVNKFWNYEARCVLRDKRKCLAVINGSRPCLRAKKLNRTLGSLNVNIFNGLSIIIDGHESEVCLSYQSVEEVYANLFNSPWKYLEFQWSMWMTEGCLLGQLILRLMSRSLTLEQLIIKSIPRGVKLEATNRPEGELALPKLKIIQIPKQNGGWLWTELLAGLLARAPNVEELRNIVKHYLIPFVPVKKLNIIRQLRIPYVRPDDHSHDAAVHWLEVLSVSKPKLTTLIAYRPLFTNGSNIRMMGDYFGSLASIIYSSSETLRQVKLDSFCISSLAVVFRSKRFLPVLNHVENLKIEMCEGPDFGIARYLSRVPLAQIFPNIKTVTFLATYPNNYSDREDDEIEQDEIFSWANVTEVKFESSKWCDQTVAELGILFPNLCSLEIKFRIGAAATYIPFRKIWSSLPFLEKLAIDGKLETRWDTNFDAEFCGIYPEEAALLRAKDEEFLKIVNIVPPFVPITYMKALKVIQLRVETYTVFPSGANTKKFFLSKVPGLSALRRMPEFEFQLHAPFEAADRLGQLKQFVKLNLRRPDPHRLTRIYTQIYDHLPSILPGSDEEF